MTTVMEKQAFIDQQLALMDDLRLTLPQLQAGTVSAVAAMQALVFLDHRMRHRVKAALFGIRPDAFKMPAGYERRTAAHDVIFSKARPSLALLKSSGTQAKHVVSELHTQHDAFVTELEYQGIPAPVLPSPAALRKQLSTKGAR